MRATVSESFVSDIGASEYYIIKRQRSGQNLFMLRMGLPAQELQPLPLPTILVFNKYMRWEHVIFHNRKTCLSYLKYSMSTDTTEDISAK
jgi:hypothetical protein